MRKAMFVIAAAIISSAAPASAQQSISPQPSGGTESIIRTPSSSSGTSNGTSGSIGSPTTTYPAPLRDFNNPAASYGRLGNPNTGTGFRRR